MGVSEDGGVVVVGAVGAVGGGVVRARQQIDQKKCHKKGRIPRSLIVRQQRISCSPRVSGAMTLLVKIRRMKTRTHSKKNSAQNSKMAVQMMTRVSGRKQN